jgi:hypothetical protein
MTSHSRVLTDLSVVIAASSSRGSITASPRATFLIAAASSGTDVSLTMKLSRRERRRGGSMPRFVGSHSNRTAQAGLTALSSLTSGRIWLTM